MSILCTFFGHKHKSGVIETHDEVLRCQRCNTQIVFPKNNALSNQIGGVADTMEAVNDYVDGELYTEQEIQNYREAADLVDK